MRIRRVGASRLVDDDVDAAIDCAMNELDALEVPYTASAPPLAAEPAQQMPRGMPPLPFVAPHPRNMPPLPAKLKAVSLVPRRSSPIMDEAAADGAARPSRWLLLVALALGIVCIGLALWLQSR